MVSRFFKAMIVCILIFLVGCQNSGASPTASSMPEPTATQIPSPLPTDTQVPTDTPAPTETPGLSSDDLMETLSSALTASAPTPDPCWRVLWPLNDPYPNPQAKLDPATGTTAITITLEEGQLFEGDSYHYWWDTRAFKADLSFNVGDGDCEVLLDTNQIACTGIPLTGTNNIATGAYEYDFALYNQAYNCHYIKNYQQQGSIFLNSGEHDVFLVNGEDPPHE